ncbi:hypothetical protein E2542_SST08900 [Spatholobus suberectus]|nr:hypothetical protein E2542_SST08900 [Spatholobus suberectus]
MNLKVKVSDSGSVVIFLNILASPTAPHHHVGFAHSAKGEQGVYVCICADMKIGDGRVVTCRCEVKCCRAVVGSEVLRSSVVEVMVRSCLERLGLHEWGLHEKEKGAKKESKWKP